MDALKHQVFQVGTSRKITWSAEAAFRHFDLEAERIRKAAEEFAQKVGAENVVSVVEHFQPRFTVVVWYRIKENAWDKPEPVDELFESPNYN